MDHNKIEKDIKIYSALISAYGNLGSFDLVWETFLELEEREIPKNVVLYTCLLKSLEQVGEYEKAFYIYEKLSQEKDIQPNNVTCSVFLSIYGKMIHESKSDVANREVLLNKMIDYFESISPNLTKNT
eukprot:UN33954